MKTAFLCLLSLGFFSTALAQTKVTDGDGQAIRVEVPQQVQTQLEADIECAASRSEAACQAPRADLCEVMATVLDTPRFDLKLTRDRTDDQIVSTVECGLAESARRNGDLCMLSGVVSGRRSRSCTAIARLPAARRPATPARRAPRTP